MAIKDLRAPDSRSGPRDIERWQREVSKKLDNSDVTLDELAAIVQTLLRDKNSELDYRLSQIERRMSSDKTAEIEYRLAELERKIGLLSSSEDLQHEMDQTRRLAWLLPQRNS